MQVVLKSHTFCFYRNGCPPMNGCYRMQTFEQLQRVRLVPRTAQAGKGVLFQPGYIAAADAVGGGHLTLGLGRVAVQAVAAADHVGLPVRQALPYQPPDCAAICCCVCGAAPFRPYRKVKICCSRSGRAVTSWRS